MVITTMCDGAGSLTLCSLELPRTLAAFEAGPCSRQLMIYARTEPVHKGTADILHTGYQFNIDNKITIRITPSEPRRFRTAIKDKTYKGGTG